MEMSRRMTPACFRPLRCGHP